MLCPREIDGGGGGGEWVVGRVDVKPCELGHSVQTDTPSPHNTCITGVNSFSHTDQVSLRPIHPSIHDGIPGREGGQVKELTIPMHILYHTSV